MSRLFGFPSGILEAIFGGHGSLMLGDLREPQGYRISATADGKDAVISVTAPADAILNARVSHKLAQNVAVRQDSNTVTITLSGAPLVSYRVEPVTRKHVSIMLNLRDGNLVVPKARGRFQWIEVVIQLPKAATWSLTQPVAAIVPSLVLHKTVDGIIHAEGEHSARQRRHLEREAAAAVQVAPPPAPPVVPDPPPQRKKAVSKKRPAKRRPKMRAERKR